MLNFRNFARCLIAVICLIQAGVSSAVPTNSSMQLAPYFATEQYFWEESIPQQADFLSESGNRYVFGLEYSNFSTKVRGMLLGIDAKLYHGSVDYSGHAFSLTSSNPDLKPFNSTTRYSGNMIQFDTGYRLPINSIMKKGSVDLLFSLGSDFWQRVLGGGSLADGTPVSSYTEYYHSIYAKAGIGLSLQTRQHKHLISFGLKRPLMINETLDFSTLGTQVELSPKPGITGFANWRIYPVIPSNRRFSLSMYFEQTRFSASDAKDLSFDLGGQTYQTSVYQPDSSSTVTGLRFLWSI